MSEELGRHRDHHKMATDGGEPDVEAHRHGAPHRNVENAGDMEAQRVRSRTRWATDEGNDDEPDVEAHRFVARHKGAGEDHDTGLNRFSGI
jgi:hypothetical protein